MLIGAQLISVLPNIFGEAISSRQIITTQLHKKAQSPKTYDVEIFNTSAPVIKL